MGSVFTLDTYIQTRYRKYTQRKNGLTFTHILPHDQSEMCLFNTEAALIYIYIYVYIYGHICMYVCIDHFYTSIIFF